MKHSVRLLWQHIFHISLSSHITQDVALVNSVTNLAIANYALHSCMHHKTGHTEFQILRIKISLLRSLLIRIYEQGEIYNWIQYTHAYR